MAMPIYEFYCRDCHTIFSFFSPTSRVERAPSCPRCQRPKLQKRPSTFAMLRARPSGDDEAEGDDPFGGLDEDRVEKAMESLAAEMEGLGDTEDPKALGSLFRRFGDLTGLEPGPRMEEALRRLETGEDMESIESDLDFDDDSEDLSELFQLKSRLLRRARRPRVDETLHFL
jgi:putative FmdB family regulatory protein